MSDLRAIPEHELLYQWGHAGKHRHHGRAGDETHGVVHRDDPRSLHHHHDERCSPPPIIRLIALWTHHSIYQTMAALKAGNIFHGGSRA